MLLALLSLSRKQRLQDQPIHLHSETLRRGRLPGVAMEDGSGGGAFVVAGPGSGEGAGDPEAVRRGGPALDSHSTFLSLRTETSHSTIPSLGIETMLDTTDKVSDRDKRKGRVAARSRIRWLAAD
jgi:hypothetical protein